MKKHLPGILLVVVFIVGLSIMLYPTISDYWNTQVQSRAIYDYESALASMTQEDYTALFEEADAYNQALAALDFPMLSYSLLDETPGLKLYDDLLNINGNGIMGYITIEKIGVELPIYHGISDNVLAVAVGHIPGTSLPVGGESTHAVLSAHRGLPSAKLFSDLDEVQVGDTFVLTMLDRVLTYEVDQILIVEPTEVDALNIVEGEDLCTLVTCTPYGINTHRLLVRGHRVENAVEKAEVYVPADAFEIEPLIVVPVLAVPMLLVLLIFLLIKYRKR